MLALAPGSNCPVITAVLGDRLEGERPDELLRRRRHHDGHVVAGLLQSAHHLDRLVGADPAGYTEGYVGHSKAIVEFID